MKTLQWFATVVLILAGVVLLAGPMHGQAAGPARFTVTDAGAVGKPDVVLIPGLASSQAVWDEEVKILAPNYRLHVVQVDGFAGAPVGGNASGPMLPGIVEGLHAYIVANGMKPVVIGHSMGGLLALMLADEHPADVKKMVIVDSLPFYAVMFSPSATVESMKPQVETIKQQMLAMPDDQYAAMQPMMAERMVISKDAQAVVAANSAKSDRKVFVMAMAEDLQTDLRGEVAKIATPTLMLYPYDPGTQGSDPATVDAIYKGAYAAMPHVTLVRVDGSRHFIMYDQPAKMDAAIERFLK